VSENLSTQEGDAVDIESLLGLRMLGFFGMVCVYSRSRWEAAAKRS
jgi:hypothetical protein